MKQILVTGGSGFLGINLIRHLLAKRYKITSLDIAPFGYREAPQIKHVLGDIRDKELVASLMSGTDAVVHTAAALPLYSEKEIYSVEIQGTRNLLEAALDKKVKRFVHISSTAVYGVPDHHPIHENDQLIGVGPYGEAKIAAEKICEDYRKKGLCVPILRPKTFIGPERLGVFAILYEWASEGRNFPILGKGNNRYQLLDVQDLCVAIESCLRKKEENVNDVFNIGATEFKTIKEDFQSVLDHAGFGKKILSIPAGPAVALLKALEKMKLSPLYEWVYETLTRESFVSIEKARKKLGFSPSYSNSQALIRNFEWYLKNHSLIKQTGEGISHTAPWKQGMIKLFKLFF